MASVCADTLGLARGVGEDVCPVAVADDVTSRPVDGVGDGVRGLAVVDGDTSRAVDVAGGVCAAAASDVDNSRVVSVEPLDASDRKTRGLTFLTSLVSLLALSSKYPASMSSRMYSASRSADIILSY